MVGRADANVSDASVKRQQIAPKKVYGIDTGLMNAVGFHTSPNTGHLLENLVYLALRRAPRDIFYYATPAGHEVDFYLPGEKLFVQVAQHLAHPGTYEREVRALREAMTDVKGSRGLLLSMDADARAGHGDADLEIRDLAAWLLG